MIDFDNGNMMADSYEDWLRFQFFNHKSNKEIPFSDDRFPEDLSVLDQVPEDLSFIETKLKEYYGVDITLFQNAEKFIILPIFEAKNLLKSFVFENNQELKEFLFLNKNFVPYTFHTWPNSSFAVRGMFYN